MSNADRVDGASLPQEQQEKRQASIPTGDDAAIHLVQQWYSLRDPAMNQALIEVPTMRRFAVIERISDQIPEETTILSFRHLLKKHGLGEQIDCIAEDCIDETLKTYLSTRAMTMRQGTIIDATLTAATSSTKNKSGKRYPEIHQTKQGNQRYQRCSEDFPDDMKIHAGVDQDSDLIHSVVVTAIKVHDLTPAPELLHGEEMLVCGDAGDQDIAKGPKWPARWRS